MRLSTLTLGFRTFHPVKIQQPRLPWPLQPYVPICIPLQTLPRDIAVRLDIFDQALLAHIVVLGPYEAEDKQVEG